MFEAAFPYYLSIGMDYETYWERSPWLTQAYREAHERQCEMRNAEMYWQGYYNYAAFTAVIDKFSWGLGKCKGPRPKPYLEYPIAFTEREKEAEKQRNIAKTLRWVEQGQKGGEVSGDNH